MRTQSRPVFTALALVLLLGLVGLVGRAWWASRVPGTYSVMAYGSSDHGGGRVSAHGHGAAGRGISVADLRGPSGRPDRTFTLTARQAQVELAGGDTIDALTFDGRLPGPELRVTQGDLVEVTVRNADVERGVTLHWHGVDVPNAEDGVAGVTQDAVGPGESHAYRFRADQAGTFWYHTHQASSAEVRRGLFGAFVIDPRHAGRARGLDLPVLVHTFEGVATLNAAVGEQTRTVPAGTPVRLRLVNTDSAQQRLTLAGTPFRVVAIDGTDLEAPTPLTDTALDLAAGGRYDVAFTMPEAAVALRLNTGGATLVLDAGTGQPLPAGDDDEALPAFDPLTYGSPAHTPVDARSRFDREFELEITRKLGFFDGKPGRHWSVNGHLYPDMPTFVVEEGDLVKVTIRNDSGAPHPMHLHGHHLLVLSRNGVQSAGSPWWSDTLDVDPGDTYEVAFEADNPGLWMNHCHILPHAAEGLTMHVAYAGVRTPFRIGTDAHNLPE